MLVGVSCLTKWMMVESVCRLSLFLRGGSMDALEERFAVGWRCRRRAGEVSKRA